MPTGEPVLRRPRDGVVWVFAADGSASAQGVTVEAGGIPFGAVADSVWVNAYPDLLLVNNEGSVVERVPLRGTEPCVLGGQLVVIDGSDGFPLQGGFGQWRGARTGRGYSGVRRGTAPEQCERKVCSTVQFRH